MKEILQIQNDLVGALESVRDKDSARVAAGKLQQVCDRMEVLGNKMRALPKITPAEDRRLEGKYKSQMEGLMQRMKNAAIQAGTNSQGEPSFIAALQRMSQAGRSMPRLGM